MRAMGLVALSTWLTFANWAVGQDQVRNYAGKPILVVETAGHHAPVRKISWLDEENLVSGGEDKVVKQWSLIGGGRLVRTFRPPLWRGLAGMVQAIAVSPRPDEAGQRFLAVGGFGVMSRRGDFTVFRSPGLAPVRTGEVAARILEPVRPGQPGHVAVVTVLAFNPTGSILASGSADRRIILWNTANWTAIRTLLGHAGPIRALDFSPDGQRLASGGADGSLRIWEVATGNLIETRPVDAARPTPVNALAYSPDGGSLLVGVETGSLLLFNARAIVQNNPVSLPTRADAGPVLALAFEPGGRRAIVSIKSDRSPAIDPVAIASDVQIRELPGGATAWEKRVPGLVRALAFSPGGMRLAYSGGHDQAIVIHDMKALDQPPTVLRGSGSTPFALGFTAGSDAIGWTRIDPAPRNPAGKIDGFDLRRRVWMPLDRTSLRTAIQEYQGWRLIGDVNLYRLEAVHTDGRRVVIPLDPATEQLWWSSTFVPPGPGHSRATIAVGTSSGVTFFDLATAARTRVFSGPMAAVVSVVPSPDGRFLACGASDQAIRLYPLAGCDTLPAFGATFQSKADGLLVESVAARGFADMMGLQPGDRVSLAYIGMRGFAPASDLARLKLKDELALFPAAADQALPGVVTIGVEIHRPMSALYIGAIDTVRRLPSTKRDNPLLTLLVGEDKEWIIWTPQGYYDTSIEGDSRFLGWHTNPAYNSTQPTDYVPIVAHAARMHQPAVIDRVFATANLSQALPAGPQPSITAERSQPPRIRLANRPQGLTAPTPGMVWSIPVQRARLTFRISSQGRSQVRSREIVFGDRVLTLPALGAPAAELEETVDLALEPNQPTRLSIAATNDGQARRIETFDVIYTPPAAAPAPPRDQARPRLFLSAFGVSTYANSLLLPVRFADRDAERLAAFLRAHLIAPDARKLQPQPTVVIGGDLARAKTIRAELDRLYALLMQKSIQPGDVLAVVVAGHLLASKEGAALAAFDTEPSESLQQVIPGRELTDLLGSFTDYGCRVVVFLDAVHPLGDSLTSRLKPFVRDLQQKKRVITVIASREGPSNVDETARQGLFALGITGIFEGASVAGRSAADRAAPFTLDQFKLGLRSAVLALSERRQEAACFIPVEVLEHTPFIAP